MNWFIRMNWFMQFVSVQFGPFHSVGPLRPFTSLHLGKASSAPSQRASRLRFGFRGSGGGRGGVQCPLRPRHRPGRGWVGPTSCPSRPAPLPSRRASPRPLCNGPRPSGQTTERSNEQSGQTPHHPSGLRAASPPPTLVPPPPLPRVWHGSGPGGWRRTVTAREAGGTRTRRRVPFPQCGAFI